MKLQVKTNNGDIIPVSRALGLVGTSNNLTVTEISKDTGRSIIISSLVKKYEDWYNVFIAGKTNAVLLGNATVVGKYSIVHGISTYIYAGKEAGYLRTISSVSPNNSGNIQLLSGNTIDVSVKDNNLSLSRVDFGITNSTTGVLIELNRMLWYLYHAQNSLIYRMNLWAPDKLSSPMFRDCRFLGIVPSYQASVAAWNMKIWRKSFLWEISPIRESISFSIGYMSLGCVSPSVRCVVTISNVAPVDDTTRFLTIYDQGVSTNLDTEIGRNITKTTSRGKVSIPGNGTDSAVDGGENWSTIVVDIDLGEMSQGDYYKAAFSLAIAQGEKTTLYYQSIADRKHGMTVEVNWIFDGDVSNKYGFVRDIAIPAMLLYPEDDDNEGYIQ